MKKFLAIILSLATMISAFAICVSAQTDKVEGEYYYTPADSVGYDQDKLLIQVANSSGADLQAVAPRIASGGVDGSNAMAVGGEMTFDRYIVPFYITGLKKDTVYVIEVDVKRTHGNIRKLQAGVWRSGAYNYSETYYENDDISSDKFTTLTFESSLSGTYIPYYLIFTFSTTSAGGTMLFDNIVIYEKNDETKTNLFDKNLNVDTGTDRPGTFDKDRELWFDNTVDEELVYTPIELTAASHRTPDNLTTEISNAGEGVKGSYAIKLIGSASKRSTLYFQGTKTGLYTVGSTYTIEMKIKKTAGAVSSDGLMIGINEGNVLFWTQNISNDALTDEWTYYKWNHTITNDGWQYLAFRFTSGSQAATIMVDDIKVYLSTDATKTPIKFEADLDADCDFDAKVEYKPTGNCGEYQLVNDVILVPTMNTTVADFKTACDAPKSVALTVANGGTAMADADILKTDDMLQATVKGDKTIYSIAVKNDVNGNGALTITDLVRAYKIMSGSVEATDAQYVAAGAAEGSITVAHTAALIEELLK